MLSITDRLTHPENPLYRLIMQAKYLNETSKALAKHLGSPINQHCRLATISSDTIILYVDSPAWYSKLRFLSPDIVRFFQIYRGITTTSKVSVHVDPHVPQRETPGERHLCISPNVAKLLRNVAHASDNPRLCEAWLRLSRHSSE